MALWAVQALPFNWGSPEYTQDGQGRTIPIVVLDDETGNWYCGGRNLSQAWMPSGGSGLSLINVAPTANARVWLLPAKPGFLMLFRDNGALMKLGADNDFVLDNEQITLNFDPGAGETFQAVVG